MFNEFESSFYSENGFRFSIMQFYDNVFVVTFSSIGECSKDIKKFLMAKAVGAILIGAKLFNAVPPKNFMIEGKPIFPKNVDYCVVAFGMTFRKFEDAKEYVKKLRIAKIIL